MWPGLGAVYTEDVTFKDPFNEVRAYRRSATSSTTCTAGAGCNRFVVTSRVVDGDQCFRWGVPFRLPATSDTGVQTGGARRLPLCWRRTAASSRRTATTGTRRGVVRKIALVGRLMRWLRRAPPEREGEAAGPHQAGGRESMKPGSGQFCRAALCRQISVARAPVDLRQTGSR